MAKKKSILKKAWNFLEELFEDDEKDEEEEEIDLKTLGIVFVIALVITGGMWWYSKNTSIESLQGPKCVTIDFGDAASERQAQGLYNFGNYLGNPLYEYGTSNYNVKGISVRAAYGKVGFKGPVDSNSKYEMKLSYFGKPLIKGDALGYKKPKVLAGPSLNELEEVGEVEMNLKNEIIVKKFKLGKAYSGMMHIVIDNSENIFENGFYGIILEKAEVCQD